MSMLHSCPRCSQVLPSSAVFCRRCGAVVEIGSRPAMAAAASVSATKKPIPPVKGYVSTGVVLALAFAAFVLVRSLFEPASVRFDTTVPMNQYNPPVQPAYPPMVVSHYPVYVPPVSLQPGAPERYPGYRTDTREHAR